VRLTAHVKNDAGKTAAFRAGLPGLISSAMLDAMEFT
jgi:hypothetical protein